MLYSLHLTEALQIYSIIIEPSTCVLVQKKSLYATQRNQYIFST